MFGDTVVKMFLMLISLKKLLAPSYSFVSLMKINKSTPILF